MMSRRRFATYVFGMGTAAHVEARRRGGAQAAPRVNGARVTRDLESLAAFGRNPGGGVSRIAYSEADRAGREYVMELMREAGLDPHVDHAANVVGRRPGTRPTLPPLLMGSHIDSVPQGGNYDGPVGSMGAIEVARTLDEQGLETRHPIEVVIFQNEEGGKTGSRAMSGELTPRDLDLPTASGKTIREGIDFLGGNPERLDEVIRLPGSVAGYLELHIEQGAILHRQGLDIGIVEGIVGIKRWRVAIEGFANHAGTTPMSDRRDALLSAARFIDMVHRVALETDGRQVATVGQIAAQPGAPNVIPGRVQVSLEIRDLDMDKIDRVFGTIRDEAVSIGERTETTLEFDEFYVSRAAPTDPRIQRLIAEAAGELGLRALRMPSGAGHDAQSVARFGPVGMVFVPSVDGISHSPRERSEPAAVTAGVDTLLRTLLRLDAVDLTFPL